MPFLEKEDFRFSIRIATLDALIDNDDSILDEAVGEAVTEMKSYLGARYAVDEIFEVVGDGRDKILTMYCRDIVLYHVFSIYNFRMIPTIRETRYKNAMGWLINVSQQKINLDWLPTNEKSFVKTGTNNKRINHQA